MGVVKPEEVRLALASPHPTPDGREIVLHESRVRRHLQVGICSVQDTVDPPARHAVPTHRRGAVLHVHSILCQLPSPMGVACTFGVRSRVSPANFGSTLMVLLDASSWICITPAVSGNSAAIVFTLVG